MAFPLHYFLHVEQAASFTGTPFSNSISNLVNSGLAGTDLGYGVRSDETLTFDFSSSSLASGWISVVGSVGTNFVPDLDQVFWLVAGPTTDLLRIKVDGTTATELRFEYWDGSAWTQIGSNISFDIGGISAAIRFDVRFILDNSAGEFSLYIDGSGTASASLTSADTITTADTTLDTITLSGPDSARDYYWGSLLVDSADTRDLYVADSVPIGNGALNEWDTGTYQDVDEGFVFSITSQMSNVITTTGDGDRDCFNMQGLPAALAGKTIEGVTLGVSSQGLGDPALFVKGLTYISSTAYVSTTPGVQASSVTPRIDYFEFLNDPSTGVAWASDTAIEAAQFGVITDTTS